MIEVVYKGEESDNQGEVRIPKNVRQIGSNQSNKKIYIQDYVMTCVKKQPDNQDAIKYGALLGEVKKGNGNTYVFVKGMVCVREIIENSIIFNDEIWSSIYKDQKEYFKELDIVGWYVSVPYSVGGDMNGIRKTHLDNFAGSDKICFFSDRTENEDGFYMFDGGALKKQQGYFIYYEKNEKMKKYMKNFNNSKSENKEESQKTNQSRKEEATLASKVKEKNTNSTDKTSFRELLKGNRSEEPKRQGRVAYGISGLLIVALLLSTVVMLNNYGELKNIKNTLSNYSVDQQAKAVNQILEAETMTQQPSRSGDNESQPESQETDNMTTTETSMEETSQPYSEQETDKAVYSSYAGKSINVKPGQTLYDISITYYGTSEMVDQIKEYNNIGEDYKIVEGQKILLP